MTPYSRLGKSRKVRAALVGVAILSQLHLFFVVDLHDHRSQSPLPQSPVSAEWSQGHVSSAPDPICAACRVSQQGALQAADAVWLPSRDAVTQKLSAAEHPKFARRVPSPLSSRAPPLS